MEDEGDLHLIQLPKRGKPTFDDANDVVRLVRELPPAHCTLRVESFSILQETHPVEKGDHFDSTEFTSGGYRWVLSVCPNGIQKENGDDHLSLYVRMVDKLSFGSCVSVLLRFFIHDQIRDNYLIIQDVREKRFQATKNEWGIPKVLRLSSFCDPSNGYVVDDCCVFGVEVLVINVENYASQVSVMKPSSDCEYTWRIEKYSVLQDHLYSPVITFEGWSWKLSLYPRGIRGAKEKSLSLFLKPKNVCAFANGSKLFAKFAFCLKNQLEGSHRQHTGERWFSATNSNWGFRDFIPLSDIYNPLNGFLVDDVIIIQVEIKVMFMLKDMKKVKTALVLRSLSSEDSEE